jgi:hypothetical protein
VVTLWCANSDAAEQASAFPEDIERFSCPVTNTLSSEGLKKAKEIRAKAAKICLACIGKECALRIWPEEKKLEIALCRNTFCVPKKMPRSQGSSGNVLEFTADIDFIVTEKGRSEIKAFRYVSGKPGAPIVRRDHIRSWESFFARLRYEPILVDGEKKRLINLRTQVQQTSR